MTHFRTRSSTEFIFVGSTFSTPHDDLQINDVADQHREYGFLKENCHYLITREGSVQTGRPVQHFAGGLRTRNECSILIMMVGGKSLDGEKAENFTDEQMDSLCSLLQVLIEAYPTARIYPTGRMPDEFKISVE